MIKFKLYTNSLEKVEDDAGDMISKDVNVLLTTVEGSVGNFVKTDLNQEGYQVPSELLRIVTPLNNEAYEQVKKINFQGKTYNVQDKVKTKRKMILYVKRFR